MTILSYIVSICVWGNLAAIGAAVLAALWTLCREEGR
jgi:hypothetical protein